MPSLIYATFLDDLLRARVDVETDSFAVMLVTKAYVPDRSGHESRSDINNEVVGEGYSAGGLNVDVVMVDADGASGADITLGAAEWMNATVSAAGAIYYRATGGPPAFDRLVAFIDFGKEIASTNGTFSLTASEIQVRN